MSKLKYNFLKKKQIDTQDIYIPYFTMKFTHPMRKG